MIWAVKGAGLGAGYGAQEKSGSISEVTLGGGGHLSEDLKEVSGRALWISWGGAFQAEDLQAQRLSNQVCLTFSKSMCLEPSELGGNSNKEFGGRI